MNSNYRIGYKWGGIQKVRAYGISVSLTFVGNQIISLPITTDQQKWSININ